MTRRVARLSWIERGLITIAALLPIGTFFRPLWHYFFEAPQYPEGLAMQIWSYQLTGRVDLINGLNHYVGFMKLDAADFWELKVLPVLVVLVVLGGLFVVIRGRKRPFDIWLAGYGLFAVLGMTDFYRWLHKFGHTVDPRAAITMEGYTPPMLGESVFMNFYITAWPGWGAYALAGGFVLGMLVWVWRLFRTRRHAATTLRTSAAAALIAALLLTGCSAPKPVPINIGQDVCAFCGMLISDPGYAAQIVTKTGKAYKFDSIESLLGFVHNGSVSQDQIHSMWVSDFFEPGKMLRVEEAHFLRGGELRSPMGLNVAAFSKVADLEQVKAEIGGMPVRYADLMGFVIQSGITDRVGNASGAGTHGHMQGGTHDGVHGAQGEDAP
ncbi:MAG: nitrous oxide reductase accessory protein NosL [Trueperaceae bacterium]|nr:nitrous oxide reductase accessory protein NosL [Trueperaceae bacterium]